MSRSLPMSKRDLEGAVGLGSGSSNLIGSPLWAAVCFVRRRRSLLHMLQLLIASLSSERVGQWILGQTT